MFTNIFLPPGSLSGGSVLVKQLFKLVWPYGNGSEPASSELRVATRHIVS